MVCSYDVHIVISFILLFFFFYNDTATTEIYTLSLHDALPIYATWRFIFPSCRACSWRCGWKTGFRLSTRSEEHTSELQSQSNLVCRLLLEKKKNNRRHAKVRQTWKVYGQTEVSVLNSVLVIQP